jgi:hypothetical protein
MADINIDVSEDGEGAFTVENPHCAALRIIGYGFSLDVSFSQAEDLYKELKEWFEAEDNG